MNLGGNLLQLDSANVFLRAKINGTIGAAGTTPATAGCESLHPELWASDVVELKTTAIEQRLTSFIFKPNLEKMSARGQHTAAIDPTTMWVAGLSGA